jgi:cob(I)alamin adenosyltransferase
MVKLNKIYTRTGDDGSTGLVDGSRRSKADARMHAIGDVDEANSAIGVAISALERAGGNTANLTRIQNDLFDLGADIATPVQDLGDEDFAPSDMSLRIVQSQVDWLEAAIDSANEQLDPLTSFILPGGSEAASAMHLARAITRRAERSMVAAGETERLNPLALAYINRLSDYLFVLCRVLNKDAGGDILWVPGASR